MKSARFFEGKANGAAGTVRIEFRKSNPFVIVVR